MAGTCARCAEGRQIKARGLCNACYCHLTVSDHDTLLDYPSQYWRSEDLLYEWESLRSQGYSRGQAAQRLGITKGRLEKAIARQRGKESV